MSGLLTTLLIGGLIIGGAVVLINPENRCNYLGLCGQTAAAVEVPVTVEVTPSTDDIAGNDAVSGSSGCCKCEHQGDKVKCLRNNSGEWFNPPAGEGGSNDSDIGLSLQECNKGCGGSSSSSNVSPKTAKEIKEYNAKPTIAQNPRTSDYRSTRASNPGTAIKNPSPTSPAAKAYVNPANSQARLNAQCKGKPKTGMCAKAQYTTAYMGNENYYLTDTPVNSYFTESDSYLASPVETVEYQIERSPKDERNRAPYYVRGGHIYSSP